MGEIFILKFVPPQVMHFVYGLFVARRFVPGVLRVRVTYRVRTWVRVRSELLGMCRIRRYPTLFRNPKSIGYLKSDRVDSKFLQHDVLALEEHSAHV